MRLYGLLLLHPGLFWYLHSPAQQTGQAALVDPVVPVRSAGRHCRGALRFNQRNLERSRSGALIYRDRGRWPPRFLPG